MVKLGCNMKERDFDLSQINRAAIKFELLADNLFPRMKSLTN